jgi:hypothetical protein
MRALKTIAVVVLALGAAVASAPALADHHWHGHSRVHFGLYFGDPFFWNPYPYYPPYYYYPPTVVMPQSPPVYIQQGQQGAQAPAGQGWWYFCRESNAYYPYVKHCPGGWERVSPQPPAQ